MSINPLSLSDKVKSAMDECREVARKLYLAMDNLVAGEEREVCELIEQSILLLGYSREDCGLE